MTLESDGWESEAGNGEMGPRNSGRVTFYKTAALSQVPVLSRSLSFSRVSHYLVPRDRERAGPSVSCGRKGTKLSQKPLHSLRAAVT